MSSQLKATMLLSRYFSLFLMFLLLGLSVRTHALSQPRTVSSTPNQLHKIQSFATQAVARREWLAQTAASAFATATATATVATVATTPFVVYADASPTTALLVDELKSSQDKLKDIPQLLQDQEWDKVRTILKTPPVNKLWNLGNSQNTVLKLAKETGNVDLFELKDDLAYNLQMCDQLTYDNVFVYFQPGNGKIKIKEPQEFAKKALGQIQQVIDS